MLIFKGVDGNNPYSWEGLQQYGKIAYIDSNGIKKTGKQVNMSCTTNIFYKQIMEYVDLYDDMTDISLEKYCAVILPAMLDEVYLFRYKNKINTYLKNGGIVFSFLQNFTELLPGNTGYVPSPMPIKDREIYITDSESSRMIFNGVREYDLNYRRGVKGFFNRGFFRLEKFAKENMPETILQDIKGECVAYIDRHSTNGIIVAAASTDLFSYGLFDNTTARRMGINLLNWLEKELEKKDYKSLREKATYSNDEIIEESVFNYGEKKETGKIKKAIITGGIAFHQKFFENKNGKYAKMFDERVYVADIKNFRFSDYDIVVLASNLNTRFLIPYKEKIEEYLKNGGNIVSLGDSGIEYLPNINWINYPTNFWWWKSEGADMPLYAVESLDGGVTFVKQTTGTKEGLFKKINVNTAKWHYHGAFIPPVNSESILVNEMDEAIIYKDKSFKGNLYVMSLDPDYHLGQGFMPTTELFFDALMEWIEEDIRK